MDVLSDSKCNFSVVGKGRQRKSCGDNIREWTGLEFAKSKRAVENREKWMTLVAKSFVVPNDLRG